MAQFNLYLLILVLLHASGSNSTEPSSFESSITDQNTQISETTEATALKRELSTLKDTMTELQQRLDNQEGMASRSIRSSGSSGPVFTRWGRKDCPAGVSELVYSGVAGGSHYGSPGGAAEYICLPKDPTFNVNKNIPGYYVGYVYGAEYEHMPVSSLRDQDVPCAVCKATGYTTVLMIPGRGKCYDGWTEAYHGELGSGYPRHAAASQFICLDQDYESTGLKDSNRNMNGKLVFPTKASCGSLPCPPYEQNALLTCAVCLN